MGQPMKCPGSVGSWVVTHATIEKTDRSRTGKLAGPQVGPDGEREATLTLQLSVKLALKQIQSNLYKYEFVSRLKSLRCAQTQQGDSLKVMAVQLAQH